MKTKITAFTLVVAALLSLNAQVTLYENFTAPFSPAASGWDVQNLSSLTGTNTTGWRQGNSAQYLTSLSGAPDDYFSTDKYATSLTGATNTISCWLITPTLNLTNGAILQFSIKSFTANPGRPERLQVYYSFGAGNNVGNSVGTPTNSAGTFTNIIADINPNMVVGFGNFWSWNNTYSLTGITTPTVGRIGFRYYIPNGGEGGPNGNYLGLDEVRYQMPCARPNFFGDVTGQTTVCVGATVPLQIQASGTNTPVTYLWFNGATTSLTAHTFTQAGTTEIWSLGQTAAGCQHLDVSYVNVRANPTLTVNFSPGSSVCAGNTVAIASSGANTYTYFVGSNSYTTNPLVHSTPQVNTSSPLQFTVSGKAANGCIAQQITTLNVHPTPTVAITTTPAFVCSNSKITLNASGAATYTWSGPVTSTTSAISYTTGTTAGPLHFSVTGVSGEGCKSAEVVRTVTVSLCTGMEEPDENMHLAIYPNPFRNELSIKNFTGRIRIYSLLGAFVMESTVENSGSIDTTCLEDGIYILKAYAERGGEKKLRIIKS